MAVAAGTMICITDPRGNQIGDMFAFVRDDPSEWLSTGATRAEHTRLFPEVGGAFVTQYHRPILTLAGGHVAGRARHALPAVLTGAVRERRGHRVPPELPGELREGRGERGHADGAGAGPGQPVPEHAAGPGGRAGHRSRPRPHRATPCSCAAEIDLVLVLTACSYDLGDANGEACTDLLIELDTPPLGVGTLDE